MHTLRDYSLPLLLAFGVHAAVAFALAQGWKPPPVEPRVVAPNIVDAALLVLERPRPKPAPPALPPPPAPKPIPEPPAVEVPKPKIDPLAEQRRETRGSRARAAARGGSAEKAARGAGGKRFRRGAGSRDDGLRRGRRRTCRTHLRRTASIARWSPTGRGLRRRATTWKRNYAWS